MSCQSSLHLDTRMSAESVLARVWAPATLTVASTVPVGFAINFLTSGAADWWWLVLGTGTIAGIVGAVWAFFAQKGRSGRSAQVGPGGGDNRPHPVAAPRYRSTPTTDQRRRTTWVKCTSGDDPAGAESAKSLDWRRRPTQ